MLSIGSSKNILHDTEFTVFIKRYPFFHKKVVFTGVLQTMSRENAACLVQEMGADIDTSINKKTDFVIVGQGAGPSKLKKIDEFNSSGSSIKTLTEVEFLSKIENGL